MKSYGQLLRDVARHTNWQFHFPEWINDTVVKNQLSRLSYCQQIFSILRKKMISRQGILDGNSDRRGCVYLETVVFDCIQNFSE